MQLPLDAILVLVLIMQYVYFYSVVTVKSCFNFRQPRARTLAPKKAWRLGARGAGTRHAGRGARARGAGARARGGRARGGVGRVADGQADPREAGRGASTRERRTELIRSPRARGGRRAGLGTPSPVPYAWGSREARSAAGGPGPSRRYVLFTPIICNTDE